SSPPSPNVNFDAPPVQPTLPLLPPNVNFDAPPVQPTLPLPPPNVNFDAPPVQPTLPPPSSTVNGDDVFHDIKNLKSEIRELTYLLFVIYFAILIKWIGELIVYLLFPQ
ncbi:hypothetical protein A2U01_0056685, partial [Trifolium medium]|nr:hypothetical protein [Trifolium medium]